MNWKSIMMSTPSSLMGVALSEHYNNWWFLAATFLSYMWGWSEGRFLEGWIKDGPNIHSPDNGKE